MYQIYGVDRTVRLTLDKVLQLTHPEDRARVQSIVDRAPDALEEWDFSTGC